MLRVMRRRIRQVASRLPSSPRHQSNLLLLASAGAQASARQRSNNPHRYETSPADCYCKRL